ncbi:hypothetical protein MWU59_04460 [Flavobacteriaceae bacterium F08102]|nr:hypothetical protein [Flavobacteriaceae bacterium F08102]
MKKLLSPFDLYLNYLFINRGRGVDTGSLKTVSTIFPELNPDSQWYFDFHYATINLFEKVNKRELSVGAGAMVSILCLFETYGLPYLFL